MRVSCWNWLLLLALGTAAGACKKEPEAGAAPAGARGGKARGATGIAMAVNVMAVESKTVDYILTAPGSLDAFERVEVTARVAGAVDKVAFKEGQEVKKGDVLVVIDSERFQLAVNSSKAQLDKVLASQKDTEAMVARREGASEAHPGLIPGEELETYKTKTLTAKADTAVAQESLKTAQLNLRDAFVRAPMAGVIQTRTVETGQYVGAGYLMATLLRDDPMLLRFQIEPENAPRLKPGMAVSFKIRDVEDTFTAKISLVAGAADPTTHTVPITAQMDGENKKYWLRPGTFGEVTIDVGAKRQAPVIPRSATRATDHGYVVYVVEGDVAKEKIVTLGMNTKDGWVEVRSGLNAAELLIVRGVESVASGSKVTASKVDSLDPNATATPLAPGSAAAPSGSAPPAGSGSAAHRGKKAPAAGATP